MHTLPLILLTLTLCVKYMLLLFLWNGASLLFVIAWSQLWQHLHQTLYLRETLQTVYYSNGSAMLFMMDFKTYKYVKSSSGQIEIMISHMRKEKTQFEHKLWFILIHECVSVIHWLSWLYTTPICLRTSSSTSASSRESAWDITALSFSPTWVNHRHVRRHAAYWDSERAIEIQCFWCHPVVCICKTSQEASAFINPAVLLCLF